MGLVSGVVNFWNAAQFAAADLDASLAAVVNQLGGTRWAAGVATVKPGNLDANNFKTGAALSNARKSKPTGIVCITTLTNSLTVSTASLPLSSVPQNMRAVALSMAYVSRTGGSDPAGVLGALKVNGISGPSLVTPKGASLAGGARALATLALDLHQNDSVVFEWAPAAFGGGTLNQVLFGLWCRAAHIT